MTCTLKSLVDSTKKYQEDYVNRKLKVELEKYNEKKKEYDEKLKDYNQKKKEYDDALAKYNEDLKNGKKPKKSDLPKEPKPPKEPEKPTKESVSKNLGDRIKDSKDVDLSVFLNYENELHNFLIYVLSKDRNSSNETHRQWLIFSQNKPTLTTPVKVKCSCQDFQMTFQEAIGECLVTDKNLEEFFGKGKIPDHVKLVEDPVKGSDKNKEDEEPKTSTRFPRNPNKIAGLCKHLIAVSNNLNKVIDYNNIEKV